VTPEKLAAIFSINVQRLLDKQKLSHEEVAELIGIDRTTVTKLLLSDKPPSCTTLVAYANALGTEPWALLKPPRKPAKK
jgi:transcriptional regulator with XRE-family HTH domain